MSEPSTLTQVSAGGVAFRLEDSLVQVALISVGEAVRWQLPKGLVDAGETSPEAALREVREEAGVETELVVPLDRIEYWYFSKAGSRRVRFHKYVDYYLLRYCSGDPRDHDHEVNEARWVEVDRAIEMLTFDNERDVVRKAKEIIQTLEEVQKQK